MLQELSYPDLPRVQLQGANKFCSIRQHKPQLSLEFTNCPNYFQTCARGRGDESLEAGLHTGACIFS